MIYEKDDFGFALRRQYARDYVLEGKTPVPAPDIFAWGQWFETADRRVAVSHHSSGVRVSTVFLGLDHALLGEKPQLFETAVFDEDCDIIARYATWNDAEEGHAAAIEALAFPRW